MSTTELVLNMLAEVSAKGIPQMENPQTLDENKAVARAGGRIAGNARKELEGSTGNSVITEQNAAQSNHVITAILQDAAENIEDERETEDAK